MGRRACRADLFLRETQSLSHICCTFVLTVIYDTICPSKWAFPSYLVHEHFPYTISEGLCAVKGMSEILGVARSLFYESICQFYEASGLRLARLTTAQAFQTYSMKIIICITSVDGQACWPPRRLMEKHQHLYCTQMRLQMCRCFRQTQK
jgi:hypothetical protein